MTSLSVGDVNQDGAADFWLTTENTQTGISDFVLLQSLVVAAGTLYESHTVDMPTNYTASSGKVQALIGNISDDGSPGLVFVTEDKVFGRPQSAIQSGVTSTYLDIALSTTSAVLADIDGDDYADFVQVSCATGTMRVYPNTQSGGFSESYTLLKSIPCSGSGMSDVAVADADNDGDADIIVAARSVQVFENSGSGSSVLTLDVADTTMDLRFLVVGDMDNDHIPEIVASSHNGNIFLFARAAGSASYSQTQVAAYAFTDDPSASTSPDTTVDLELVDMNFDGTLDIAFTTNYNGGQIGFFALQPDGTRGETDRDR